MPLYRFTSASQCSDVPPIQPTNSRYKNLKSTNPHSMQNFVVLFVYVLMHALPGIVDGARKTWQFGRRVRGDARGRSCRLSSLPMLEATISRNQGMSAVTPVVHHSGRGSSAVSTSQQISERSPIRLRVEARFRVRV